MWGFVFNIAKEILVNPILKQMEKEVKEEKRLYNQFLNQIDQNIELENSMRGKIPHTIEVHQPYDPIIHEHDFW